MMRRMKMLVTRFFILLAAVMVFAATSPCTCTAHAAVMTHQAAGCCSHCSKTTPLPVECPHCTGSAFEKTTPDHATVALTPPVLAMFAAPVVLQVSAAIHPIIQPIFLPTSSHAQTLLSLHCALVT